MIFEADKDSLYRSIAIVDSIVSSKSINTMLANCLFKVFKDSIEITSTDNEIAIRTRLDAVSDAEGVFTANGKRFSNILKELPRGEVVISVSDSFMVDVKTKSKEIKAHYALVGTSREEYPEISFVFNENVIEVDQTTLREMLRKVIHAAAMDVIKPVFNGVYMLPDTNGRLTVVATDSRRLSMISRSVGNIAQMEDGVIIPLKTVHELVRLLSGGGTTKFSLFENQCYFRIGETDIVSRVVDGQFPNFRQVIPKEQAIHAVMDTKRLLDSLRRAMVFTREPANKVVLHFSQRSLLLETKTPDLGEAEEEIAIDSNAKESLSIGINAQFMMDVLKEIDVGSVKLGLTGQMSPVTLSPENDNDFLSVIMPIQIKSS